MLFSRDVGDWADSLRSHELITPFIPRCNNTIIHCSLSLSSMNSRDQGNATQGRTSLPSRSPSSKKKKKKSNVPCPARTLLSSSESLSLAPTQPDSDGDVDVDNVLSPSLVECHLGDADDGTKPNAAISVAVLSVVSSIVWRTFHSSAAAAVSATMLRLSVSCLVGFGSVLGMHYVKVVTGTTSSSSEKLAAVLPASCRQG